MRRCSDLLLSTKVCEGGAIVLARKHVALAASTPWRNQTLFTKLLLQKE